MGPLITMDDLCISCDSPKGDVVFISHAHADHVPRRKSFSALIASNETRHVAGIYGRHFSHPKVKMFNSGHILGARGLVVDCDDKVIVYTGDMRLKQGAFGERAELVESDVLYIDATYADPMFKFPDPHDVYDSIVKWVGMNEHSIVLFGAYPIGKTQELVKVLNEFGVTPILHKKNYYYCERYNQVCTKLDFLLAGTDEAHDVLRDGGVLIAPRTALKERIKNGLEFVYSRRVFFAVATGWILKYKVKAHAAFPLSDHADFQDIIYYIQESGAKEVYPLFGKKQYLQNYFRLSDVKVL